VVRWLRRDQRIGRGKLLCLAGLGLVGALLAARLMPQLEPVMVDWVTKSVELLAWSLVLAGQWLSRARAARPPQLTDGFV